MTTITTDRELELEKLKKDNIENIMKLVSMTSDETIRNRIMLSFFDNPKSSESETSSASNDDIKVDDNNIPVDLDDQLKINATVLSNRIKKLGDNFKDYMKNKKLTYISSTMKKFYKIKDSEIEKYYQHCKDCTHFRHTKYFEDGLNTCTICLKAKKNRYKETKKQCEKFEKENPNKKVCNKCKKKYSKEEMGAKSNGDPYENCKKCREYESNRKKKQRNSNSSSSANSEEEVNSETEN